MAVQSWTVVFLSFIHVLSLSGLGYPRYCHFHMMGHWLRVACGIGNNALIISRWGPDKDRSQMRLGAPMKLPGRTHLQGVLEPFRGP